MFETHWGGWDGETRIWSVREGTSRVLHQCQGYAFFASFDPNGRVGATCADGTAITMDPGAAATTLLRGHVGHVTDVRFSPDDAWMATSGDDGTVRVWSKATGRPHWHATMLRSDPPEVLTHTGWARLDGDGPVGDETAAWRKAVASRARKASSFGSLVCAATHDETLDAWDCTEDRRRWSKPLSQVRRVIASPGGCLVLQRDGSAVLLSKDGVERSLAHGATAVAAAAGELLVATKDGVRRFDEVGEQRGNVLVSGEVTALARLEHAIAVGSERGDIRISPLGEGPAHDVQLAALPSARVEVLMPGPGDTLVAGFSNGLVGVWDLRHGACVFTTLLHGRVTFLEGSGGLVHAVSELGDHDVLDLTVLRQPYCEVLRDVWSRVPVVWERGRAHRRGEPPLHECAQR